MPVRLLEMQPGITELRHEVSRPPGIFSVDLQYRLFEFVTVKIGRRGQFDQPPRGTDDTWADIGFPAVPLVLELESFQHFDQFSPGRFVVVGFFTQIEYPSRSSLLQELDCQLVQ